MSLLSKTIWLVVFAIAMGFLEAAVVVYLRELYYPNGFAFPLVVLDPRVGLVEILREAATLIMLVSMAALVGENMSQRIAFFLIAFAVWDIFYYVFLKLTLGWPSSVFTWDILFLIPAPWVGPVLSPLISCLTMLGFAALILGLDKKGFPVSLRWTQWSMIVAGSLVTITAWLWDYLIVSGGLGQTPEQALQILSTYIPARFNWWIFGLGELLILGGIAQFYFRFKASRGILP